MPQSSEELPQWTSDTNIKEVGSTMRQDSMCPKTKFRLQIAQKGRLSESNNHLTNNKKINGSTSEDLSS